MSRVSGGAGREIDLGWCARGDVVGGEFFTRGGDRPTVTEGICQDAVPLSPEHLLHGYLDLRTCLDRALCHGVDVVHVDVEQHRRPADRRRGEGVQRRRLLADEEPTLPEGELDEQDCAVGQGVAEQLDRAEGSHIEAHGVVRLPDEQVRRQSDRSQALLTSLLRSSPDPHPTTLGRAAKSARLPPPQHAGQVR